MSDPDSELDENLPERDPDTDDMFGSPEPTGMREAEAASEPAPAVEAKAAPKEAASVPADTGPAAHSDDRSLAVGWELQVTHMPLPCGAAHCKS